MSEAGETAVHVAAGATEPLEALLDALEAPAPSPCGGSAAAVAAAMAASLVAMVARGSRDWPDGAGVADTAKALRERLTVLAREDESAFGGVLATMRDPSGGPEQRDVRLGRALLRAATVPLRIAEAAADVTELAAMAADRGAPPLQPDAVAAAALAEAAVRAATHLVEINLAVVPGDGHALAAAELTEAAAATRRRALGGRG